MLTSKVGICYPAKEYLDLGQNQQPRVITSPSPSPSPTSRGIGTSSFLAKRPSKAQRLVLKVENEFLDKLNPMQLRDQVNDAFFQAGYNELIVAIISRSSTN